MTAYGPLISLALRVHELSLSGRCHDALAAADAYLALARTVGDEKTIGFLIQGKMYAHLMMGSLAEALAVGEILLERYRSSGFTLGEAKVLADLAELYILDSRYVEGMRCLARASLLLDEIPRRDERYRSALASLADSANVAELYETSAEAYARLSEMSGAQVRTNMIESFELAYAGTLVYWGLRLDHLGQDHEATMRLCRSVHLARLWVDGITTHELPTAILVVKAILAAGLAKLGDADEARQLAEDVVLALREAEHYAGARLAHLALGMALRAQGDLNGARREFVAAEQLCEFSPRPDERLIIRHEMALLAAQIRGDAASRDLLDTVRQQARRLWELRLQRLAMLRQARQREELESTNARIEREMLHDALTGLPNRRRFDQMMSAINAGDQPLPTVLLLVDIDRFKAINDTYSHSAGDLVLREVAAILRTHCRAEDVPVRYAGDEFTIFLRTDRRTGMEVAERIRACIAGTDFGRVTPGMTISISTGIAELTAGMTAEDLFHAADQRLYEAKRHGRDRIAA